MYQNAGREVKDAWENLVDDLPESLNLGPQGAVEDVREQLKLTLDNHTKSEDDDDDAQEGDSKVKVMLRKDIDDVFDRLSISLSDIFVPDEEKEEPLPNHEVEVIKIDVDADDELAFFAEDGAVEQE